MSNQKVTVRVPASTANLGPGFDALGLAFQLYTTVSMCIAEETSVHPHGEELQSLPRDKSNLLYQAAAFLYEQAALPIPELRIEVSSEVPLTRGLGSSAAALVGALVAANSMAGEPFTRNQIYTFASNWEGHPDNVGASLFGGFIVAALPEIKDEEVPFARFSVPSRLKTLVVIPEFELPTHKARSALPDSYSREVAIYNLSRTGLLVAAFAQDKLELLRTAMQDQLHQPYRTELVPGLSEIVSGAVEHGALGAALSGAGPTILCFYEDENAGESLVSFVDKIMQQHEISYQSMTLSPDDIGVSIDISPVVKHNA